MTSAGKRIRIVAVAAAAALLASPAASVATTTAPTTTPPDKHELAEASRWGLVIDLDRCTACQACVVACKHENNLAFSTPAIAEQGRLMTWIQLLPVETDSGGTMLRISTVEHLQPATHTVLGWIVSDIKRAITGLARRGEYPLDGRVHQSHNLVRAGGDVRSIYQAQPAAPALPKGAVLI